MRIILSLCLLALSAFTASAQGIRFDEGDWATITAKAKKEKKLIYMDAYTTWCGPCKMLAANIFPQKAAGDYYNAHFVNYRVDAEKGEGITLAQKYAVNSYPTHLFIDPNTGNIVYRNSGYSPEVSHFVHEGEVAGLEWKDPMTLDKYAEKFAASKGDRAFLRAYLEKTRRLGKNNDELLDAYVTMLQGKVSDEEIRYLEEHIRSLDNSAVALVSARPEIFARAYPDRPNYLGEMNGRWAGGTFEKAVATRNEGLLDKMGASLKQYNPETAEEEMFYWRNRYFTETNNPEGAKRAAVAEADYLLSKSAARYAAQDEGALAGIREQMKAQLAQMKVPQEQWEQLIQQNLASQPALLHSASIQGAQKLNSSAWGVYENSTKDPAMLKMAMSWSKKAMELGATAVDQWPAFADTHAHLLYASGDKAGAVALEQQAVDKLKAAGSAEVATYEAELTKMKTGTL